MRRVVLALVYALLVTVPASGARADEVVDLVRRTLGERVGPSARYEMVARDEDRAVVMVRTTAGPPAKEDRPGSAGGSNVYWYYAHLERRDGAWSMAGLARALPPSVREQADTFRSVSAADLAKASGAPQAEIEADRRRLLLAASEDEALLRHFAENRPGFERIRAILTRRPHNVDDETRVKAGDAELGALFAESAIAYADRIVLGDDVEDDRGCFAPGCFTLAVLFSAPQYKVGYFYAPQPERVPRMTPREYLVIRPLGDGWYFFRQN